MLPFRSKKYQEQMQKPTPVAGDVSSQWIMRREQLPEYRFALELMSLDEKKAIFWRDWDNLDELAQRDLVKYTFDERWYELIAGYSSLSYEGRLQVLEALGHIHNINVVDFLMSEMRREDDNIRLAAAGALKKQDPMLTIEPMLEALCRPEVFLASRIFDILRTIGPKLVPVILTIIDGANLQGKIVMAQLLGAFGDETVLPVLESLSESEDYTLRKIAVEALAQIGTEAILPVMERIILDERWQLRLIVVEAIGHNQLVQGVPLLERALWREQDPLVKEIISETIHQLDETKAPITYLWRREGKEGTHSDGSSKYRSKHRNRNRNTKQDITPTDHPGSST